MESRATESFPALREFLRRHLLDDIMPFWTTHAIDEAGGINTCIRNDGTLASRDKWVWGQWRSVWMFATLYNMIEPRREWLDIAQNICDFCTRHGWDDEFGGWVLTLSADGQVITGCDSIYSDTFAIYGLVALAKATNEQAPIDLARKTADHLVTRLRWPHDQIPHNPFPIPSGAKVHGIAMMTSFVLWELGELLDDDKYRRIALEQSDDIFDHFYRRDRDMLLERIAADNSEYPPPLGTTIVPGHVIEDMWFQIHIARDRGDEKRIELACDITRRHMQIGWDDKYGGLLLAVDADGRDEVGWEFANRKIWWPHTEAMYALLLAYEHSRADWALQWYDRLHEYVFAHYPIAEHGEWWRNLNRDGTPMDETVSLNAPVKDPFHLPRALIYCIDVLGRLALPSDNEAARSHKRTAHDP